MSRKSVTYTQTIDRLERLNNSTNGNPRFRIHFADGQTAVTQSDASIAYGLEDRKFFGVPVKVTATPAGMVWNVELITESTR